MKRFLYFLFLLLFIGSCSSNKGKETNKHTTKNSPPEKVTLSQPENGATQTSTVTFIWKGTKDPDKETVTYSLYLGTSKDNMKAKVKDSLDTTTTLQLEKGTYYWKVIASDPHSVTSASETWSFTVNNPPTAPEPTSPANGVQDITEPVTLKWNPATDPDGDTITYTVYLGTSPDNLQEQGSTTNTKLNLPTGLDGTKLYYWKVVASDGELTAESEVSVFTVNHPPVITALTSPAEDSYLPYPVNFSWQVEDQDNDPTICTLFFGQSQTPATAITTTTQNYYSFTPTQQSGDYYYWRVSCQDYRGGITESAVSKFKINFPPSAPELLEPDNNTSNLNYDVKLSWKPSIDVNAEALSYFVYVTDDSGEFGSPITDVNFDSNEGVYYLNLTDLKANTTYKWKVVVTDGTYYSSSPVWKFTVRKHYFTEVARGGQFTCAIDSYNGNNELWCWGANFLGQVGKGQLSRYVLPPVRIKHPEGRKWLHVSAGSEHVCAADDYDQVWCWGHNNRGQVKPGSTTSLFSTPQKVLDWVDKKVYTGSSFSCIIDDMDGYGWCWGWNGEGELGSNNTDSQPADIEQIVNPENDNSWVWRKLAPGGNHTCGIGQTFPGSKKLYCWGYNYYGQVGTSPAGSGQKYYVPQEVKNPDDKEWIDVTTGAAHSCGIDSDHNLWCWGYNGNKQLGVDSIYSTYTPQLVVHPEGLKWEKVSAGFQHTCAIDEVGQVYCWGWNIFGGVGDGSGTKIAEPILVSSLADKKIVALSKGSVQRGMCAIDDLGDLYCWGNNSLGETNAKTTGEKFTPVEIQGWGDWHAVLLGEQSNNGYSPFSCGFDDSGIKCWGSNINNQLANGNLQSSTKQIQVNFDETVNPLTIAIGWSGGSACTILKNGHLYCWGRNDHGQLGIGSNSPSKLFTPTMVTDTVYFDFDQAKQIMIPGVSTGGAHTCFISYTSRQLYCMGANSYGEIGDGTTTDKYYPYPVTLYTKQGTEETAYLVFAGPRDTCALDTDGRLFCWGDNEFGEAGVSSSQSKITAPMEVTHPESRRWSWVAPSYFYTCAVDEIGKLYCWGRNLGYIFGTNYIKDKYYYAPVTVETTLTFDSNYSLAAGYTHICGLTDTGEVYCWGNNFYGQLGVGVDIGGTPTPQKVTFPDGETITMLFPSKSHTCAISTNNRLFCWGGDFAQIGFLNQPDEVYRTPIKVDW